MDKTPLNITPLRPKPIQQDPTWTNNNEDKTPLHVRTKYYVKILEPVTGALKPTKFGILYACYCLATICRRI